MGHGTAAMAQETATDLECRLAQAQREASEAREQLAATDEVLRVISSSPGQLEPVFRSLLENATRICGAKFGAMYLSEGNALRIVAMHNVPPAFAELRRRNPVFRANPRIALARAAATKQTVHIADVQAEPVTSTHCPALAPRRLACSPAHEPCLPSRCSRKASWSG